MQDLYSALNEEEKVILYSLGALSCSPINNKTKLQKLLFLTSNVFPDYKELIDFEPHLFGPFSEDIEVIIDDLIRIGLVDNKGDKYFLTRRGIKLFSHLKPADELMRVIEDFKDFLNDLTNDELLTFVYVSYPEYIEESIKWDQLKGKRVMIAISLLKKQKISFTKAVEIAGLPTKDFEDILVKRKIKWKQDPKQ